MEDGTSVSGNSNNVFGTTSGPSYMGGGGLISGGTNGTSSCVPDFMNLGSAAVSSTNGNNTIHWQQQRNGDQSAPAGTLQRPALFTVGSYEESSFFPLFDNPILIDPVQRQREHYSGSASAGGSGEAITPVSCPPAVVTASAVSGTATAVYSDPHRTIIRHNCLNHHPYGTFYYSKKSGKTGRHFPHPVAPPRLPSSPTLNSHHHTVMAGPLGTSGTISPNMLHQASNSAASNLRYAAYRHQPSPLLWYIDIWPACNSRLTQRETNQNIA